MKLQLLTGFLLLSVPACFMYGYEVPTTLQKKNILLEEFTGISCGNCPQGHKVANALNMAQPESTFVIAVHAGSFSKPVGDFPDFRTDEGEQLVEEFGVEVLGYPSGTVNRHAFEGTSVVAPKSKWIKYGKQINSEDAPVNLWIKSEFDGNTNQLKVRVEGYYTTDEQTEKQYLNVVWTQDNIMGPQSGGGVGEEYIHRHMLRGYLTPVWGDLLASPKKGDYFEKEYIYQLPETVKKTTVKPEDIEVIAFVTQEKKEVLNVTGSKPSYSNFEHPLAASLSTPKMEIGSRYGYNYFEATLTNESDKVITTAEFEIDINNEEPQQITWNGNISSFASIPIVLNVSSYVMNDKNDYKITLTSLNGKEIKNSSIQGTFAAPLQATPTVNITIQTDLFADENTFTIKNSDGEIVKEFGPYVTDTKAVYQETAELEANKTYCFEILDKWGDGIQQPKGYVKIHTDNNALVEQNYDIQLFGSRSFFRTSLEPSGITKSVADRLYKYDPETKTIYLVDMTTPCVLSLYSIEGKRIMQKEDTKMTCSTITNGIYLLQITKNGMQHIFKIAIN